MPGTQTPLSVIPSNTVEHVAGQDGGLGVTGTGGGGDSCGDGEGGGGDIRGDGGGGGDLCGDGGEDGLGDSPVDCSSLQQ